MTEPTPHRDKPFAGGLVETARRLAIGDAERSNGIAQPDARSERRYLVAAGAAAIPCLAAMIVLFGGWVIPMALTAIATTGIVESAFALVRGRRIGGGAVVWGLLLVLMIPPIVPPPATSPVVEPEADDANTATPLARAEDSAPQPGASPGAARGAAERLNPPPDASEPSADGAPRVPVPLWMVALGAAFAAVFGKEVFGGTGDHLFAPPLVGKAFLMFSFPARMTTFHLGSLAMVENGQLHLYGAGEGWAIPPWMLSAILMGVAATVLVASRPGNWQIYASIALGSGAVAWAVAAGGSLPEGLIKGEQMLVSDGFLLAAVFFAIDPAVSPRSRWGKWVYGLLIGASAVTMRAWSNYAEAMISAVLLGNVFAPMFDTIDATDEQPEDAQASEGAISR